MGAEYILTQLFFDNSDYFSYIARLKSLGIDTRVIPGIVPIGDYKKLVKFCSICGATITDEVRDIFSPLSGNNEESKKAGIDFAVRQSRVLLAGGASGIHFFTLNRSGMVVEILKQLDDVRI